MKKKATPKKPKTNTNYRKGADLERDIKKYLEKNDYIAMRSAGSHGIFDVLAFDGRVVWAIQAKIGARTKAAADKLADQMVIQLQAKFRQIAYPIFVMAATGMAKTGPTGSIRLLVPEALREAAQEEIRKDANDTGAAA